MELTPQTLHAVEFREARRGGYNTRDVDDFLERVAQGVSLLHERMRDLMMRVEGSDGRMADMHRQLEEAQRRPAPEVSETDDTLRRTLVLAQRTADATIKEAKDEAARVLSEAREEATRTRSDAAAEARRGTEGARAAAEHEIEQLLDTRDSLLKRDIDALGDRMRDQRERIRSGIAELEQALDQPTFFEPAPPIALTQVDSPGQTGRHSRVEIGPPTPMPEPAPAPSLPMRKAPAEPEPATNGVSHEPAVPFLPGSQVASLQDNPPLPSRRGPAELAPTPAPPGPFGFNGTANGDGGPVPAPGAAPAPWPSQLRTSVDDGGPGAAPAPGNGGESPDGIGIEPGSRPSESGRPVFDRDDEGEPTSRFGGR